VQCSAVQCSAVQCSAVQCHAEQCSAVQCSAVHRRSDGWACAGAEGDEEAGEEHQAVEEAEQDG
jgi:hypothetical protein